MLEWKRLHVKQSHSHSNPYSHTHPPIRGYIPLLPLNSPHCLSMTKLSTPPMPAPRQKMTYPSTTTYHMYIQRPSPIIAPPPADRAFRKVGDTPTPTAVTTGVNTAESPYHHSSSTPPSSSPSGVSCSHLYFYTPHLHRNPHLCRRPCCCFCIGQR